MSESTTASTPYTVCYMMTSADGRIDCAMTAQLPGVEEYYPLLEELGLQSAVSGRVTAELEIAQPGRYQAKDNAAVGRETVSKKCDSPSGYDIIVDTKGGLLWKQAEEYEKPIIIVLSEQAANEYLAYLDERSISYIVTGKNKIDLARASVLLREQFNIERMGVVGGPTINTAFLDAGLLDEVIILIGAGIDGRASYPPVFNSAEEGRKLTPLELISAEQFASSAVLIRYKVINSALK